MGDLKQALQMSVGLSLFVVLFSVSLSQTQGSYLVGQSKLIVLYPTSIEGRHDVAISKLGRPAYPGSILGALKVPKQGVNACTDFKKFGVTFTRSDGDYDYRHSPIALVESSGGCDFAWKVYNAQNAGALGVLIVDTVDESLDDFADLAESLAPKSAGYWANITIPSVLINKTVGDMFKRELNAGNGAVNVKLEWDEAPSEPVKYEIWTNGQDKCGPRCDSQVEFVKNFRGTAQILEKGGYTIFTPHFILWYCPPKYVSSKECQAQCINKGRYCSPDPEDDFESGYNGKDVVIESLRQLCLHKGLVQQKRRWIFWDYIADYQARCSMKNGTYDKECGNIVASTLGLNVTQILECMGNSELDQDHHILKAEQEQQTGNEERGDVTITPTVVINNKMYSGKLEYGAVLKSLCGEFAEGEEPSICLGSSKETDECLVNNGGCWIHDNGLITACKDTFKGRLCECPYYEGVQWEGDGFTHCEPVGLGRCRVENDGCWQETKGNRSYSACSDATPRGCECPDGFSGTGVGSGSCVDRDECTEKTHCQCSGCQCSNTWGSFDCSCSAGRIYLRESDACVRETDSGINVFWLTFVGIATAVIFVSVVGFLVYKYKVRSYMDSKIRATLSQYMPLDSNNQDIYRHLQEEG